MPSLRDYAGTDRAPLEERMQDENRINPIDTFNRFIHISGFR